MKAAALRRAADAFAALIPPSRLHPAALAWARRRPRSEAWAVAFSGGADSLALLLLLRAGWPGRRLVALHFDHRLRGAASAADAAFCRRACRALGVPCATGAWRRPPPAASEARAREARMDFFGRAMKARGLRALWLGHQQDDVAETLLMRLARGSGTAGLAAPRPLQPAPWGGVRLRPLLTLKKREIEAALRAAGLEWRRDATNASGAHFRNRVRRSVVPAWLRAAGRDAVAGAALSRELLEEDDVALEQRVDALRPLRGRALQLTALAGEPRAVLRRALRRWAALHGAAGELSRQGFEQLLEAVEAGGDFRRSFGPVHFAVRRGDRLALRRSAAVRPT